MDQRLPARVYLSPKLQMITKEAADLTQPSKSNDPFPVSQSKASPNHTVRLEFLWIVQPWFSIFSLLNTLSITRHRASNHNHNWGSSSIGSNPTNS